MNEAAMKSVLLVDDDTAIRTVLSQALERAGYHVRATGNLGTLWRWVSNGEGDLVVSDVVLPDGNAFELMPRMKMHRPDLPIIIMSAQNTFMTAIKASEKGAYEYLPKPFDLKELISTVERAFAQSFSSDMLNVPDQHENMPLVGRSPAMQEVYRVIARLMQSDLTLMINGESGTGKELVARALHDYGKRKNAPFVAVNVAAIPRDLIESELFGHEKGAFTGAISRASGKFEQAEGGTLFLDEIGDMPMDAQTRLLRVLQQGEYTTVGGRRAIQTDVRIVAATNKNLAKLISEGQFREDLYYRLNVVPLRIPPLRERVEDIHDLVQHFLNEAAEQGGTAVTFDAGALEVFRNYGWPGNVRELENLVRRIVALYPQETISQAVVEQELFHDRSKFSSNPDDAAVSRNLPALVEAYALEYLKNQQNGGPQEGDLYESLLTEIEQPLIAVVLAATNGNQIKAAQILGLNRNTLRKKIRHLGVNVQKRSGG